MEFAVGVHMLDERQMAGTWTSSQLKTPPSLLQPILVSYDGQHAHASANPGHDHVDRDFITCPVDVIQTFLHGILECHPLTPGIRVTPGVLPLSQGVLVLICIRLSHKQNWPQEWSNREVLGPTSSC